MPWPLHPTETTGAGGRISGADLNEARKLSSTWESEALSASAIAIDGDGKYTVTYSGAQNLDNVTGATDGDQVWLRADVTGAGANLTIRHNQGNIRTSGTIPITLSADTDFVIGIMIGSVLKVAAL